MRVGFALGNIGPIGTAENLVKIAQRAEALAYDSLWTVERLLWPVAPQTPYAATPDGSLPGEYRTPSRPEKEQRPQSSAGDDCRGHRIECFPTVKAAMCVNDVCQQVVHVMLS